MSFLMTSSLPHRSSRISSEWFSAVVTLRCVNIWRPLLPQWVNHNATSNIPVHDSLSNPVTPHPLFHSVSNWFDSTADQSLCFSETRWPPEHSFLFDLMHIWSFLFFLKSSGVDTRWIWATFWRSCEPMRKPYFDYLVIFSQCLWLTHWGGRNHSSAWLAFKPMTSLQLRYISCSPLFLYFDIRPSFRNSRKHSFTWIVVLNHTYLNEMITRSLSKWAIDVFWLWLRL